MLTTLRWVDYPGWALCNHKDPYTRGGSVKEGNKTMEAEVRKGKRCNVAVFKDGRRDHEPKAPYRRQKGQEIDFPLERAEAMQPCRTLILD